MECIGNPYCTQRRSGVEKMSRKLRFLLFVCLLFAFVCNAAGAEIQLPSGLQIIEDEAFFNNQKMEGLLVLPDQVEDVGSGAFSAGGFYALEVPEGTKQVGAQSPAAAAYVYLHGTETEADPGLFADGKYAFVSPDAKAYEAAAASGVPVKDPALLVLHDGFYYYPAAEGTSLELLCARDATKVTGPVTVPETVGEVPVGFLSENAFFGCNEVTNIRMPYSVQAADGAFSGCPAAQVEYYGIKPLQVISVACEETLIRQGDTVTWTVLVDGGVEPYRYSWQLIGGENESETAAGNEAAFAVAMLYTGENYLKVTVTDGEGREAFAQSAPVWVEEQLPISASITAAPQTYITGTPVAFAAVWENARPGAELSMMLLSGEEQLAFAAGTELTFTFETAGEYTVKAVHKDPVIQKVTEISETFAICDALQVTLTAREENVYAGRDICWQAEITGGWQPYAAVSYTVYCNGEAVEEKELSEEGAVVYTADVPGIYELEIRMVDARGNALSVKGEAVDVSYRPVQVKAIATGGDAWYVGDAGSWTVELNGELEDYYLVYTLTRDEAVVYETESSSLVFEYLFTEPGTYLLTVQVMAGENAPVDTFTEEKAHTVDYRQVVLAEKTVAPEMIYAGDEVTFAYRLENIRAGMQAKFSLMMNEENVFEQTADYVPDETGLWDVQFCPVPEAEGRYTAMLAVVLGDETLLSDTTECTAEMKPLEVKGIEADVQEIYTGSRINWIVTAANGSAPYRYAYRVYRDGAAYTPKTGYSTADTYGFTATESGVYTLEVSVRDSNLEIVTLQDGAVTVREPEITLLKISTDAPETEKEVSFTMAVEGTLEGAYPRISLYAADAEEALAEAENVWTLSHIFETAGTYRIRAAYVDAAGITVDEKEMTVQVAYRPLTVKNVTVSPENLYLYDTAVWQVELDGELNKYLLSYSLNRGEESVWENTSRALQAEMYFIEEGTYTLVIRIRTEDGTELDVWTSESYEVTHQPVLCQSYTASPDTCYPQEEVTFAYALENVEDHYTLRMDVVLDQQVISSQSCVYGECAEGRAEFAYSFAGQDTYQIVLTVMDGEKELYTRTDDYVVEMLPLNIAAVQADSQTAFVYDTMNWHVQAEGGVAPYSYAYILYRDGEEIDFVEFGDADTYSYALDLEGEYVLEVYVKDGQKKNVIFTADPVTVTLKELKILSAAVAEPHIKYTEKFAFTVEAEGGRQPLSYEFVVKTASGSTSLSSGALTENTFEGIPSFRGSSTCQITVTDGDGTKVSATITGLNVYTAMTLSNLTVDTEEIRALEDVTWSVTRTDGHVNCDYIWTVYCDAEEEAVVTTQEPTLVYAPQQMGAYSVYVIADDGTDRASYAGTNVNVLHAVTDGSLFRYSGSVGGAYALYGDYTGTDPHVVIPEYIDGKRIQHIVTLRSNLITTLEIPESISIMYPGAIQCRNLTSVSLPTGWGTKDSTDDSMRTYGPFSGCSNLKTITMPEGETYVTRVAFAGATGLENIHLPSTLKSIGPLAFNGCTSLASIDIPDGVESMGSHAFQGTAITTVTVPSAWKEVTFTYGDWYNDYYGSSPFAGSSVQEVILPDALTALPDFAFDDAAALTTIRLHDNITSIGNYAFNGCTGLTVLEVPDSVTDIGLDAFKGCGEHFVVHCGIGSAAETYCIKNGVNYVSEYEYSVSGGEVTIHKYLGSASDVVVPSSIAGYPVTTIGSYTETVEGFGYTYEETYGAFGLRTTGTVHTITLPDSVTTIEDMAFYDCYASYIILGKNVKSIGYNAFMGCNLMSLYLPDSLTEISRNSFMECRIIGELRLPSWIDETALKEYFWNDMVYGAVVLDGNPYLTEKDGLILNKEETKIIGCVSGTTIAAIPDTVTTIGTDALWNYTGNELTVPSTVTVVQDLPYCLIHCAPDSAAETFARNAGINTINHFDFTVTDGECTITAYKWTDNQRIRIPSHINGNPVVDIGILFSGNTSITSITLPNTVKVLQPNAFMGCTSLSSVSLGTQITEIGDYAFQDCTSLTGITFPSTLQKVGAYAFSGCTKLTNVNMNYSLTTIGEAAFYNCTTLKRINMPNSITRIEKYAFRGCYVLTNVTLPKGLTYLGSSAFYECYALDKVIIPDGVTAIYSGTFSYTGLTKIWLPASVTSCSVSAFDGLSSRSVEFWVHSNISLTVYNNIGGWNCVSMLGMAGSVPSSF